ncbi:uncharacterized protein RHOBADRAFT_41201 [Rhodotorula graminis WP1]|uniref:Xylanolytic transcriptional activator regulatory domain-containing protein n=1 Tax=Rhodotorula graminis (strain WP1) TaxID=578459 RepID=A0A194SDI6_RHOGW|nr:uncharacterized protein RHOBADRAFT_41201 [Rhodotorula graminis WP1]KPV78657.1 hypothetical protein RHOBADRAFT_41201 [Rhodotorula graminis WP1]
MCNLRKTRCDKGVPCGNCVKRNKAHLCHIVPHVRPKDADRLRQVAAAGGTPLQYSAAPLPPPLGVAGPPGTPPITPAGTSGDPRLAHTTPATVDALAMSAFAEVEAIHSTIDGLRTRLTGLESLLVAAFGRLAQDEGRCAEVNAALQGGVGAARAPYGVKPDDDASSHMRNAVGLTFDGSAQPPFPLPSRLHDPHGDIFVSSSGLTPYASGSATAYPPFMPPPLHPSHSPHPYPHQHDAQRVSRPSTSGGSGSMPPEYGLDRSASSSHTTAFTLPPLEGGRGLEGGTGPSSEFGLGAFEQAGQAARGEEEAGAGAEMDERDEEGRERSDELREEEVAASLSLEFMALGRNRALTGPQSSAQNAQISPHHPVHLSSVFDPASLPQHPSAQFPTSASLARVLPPPADTHLIIEHALESTGWHHACIHAPSFRAELAEFMSHPDETRFETASPAWLALLFAQLACGVKHMTREQLKQLGPFGLNDDDMRTLTKTHLDAALACLYRSHFLENHQLHAVQAITILVVGCQDVPQSNLFPMLLSTGICLAQDLGLHRLPSEELWLASVEGQSLEARAKSLIAYETRKRVFWALTSQDWFSIPYRRTTAVQPTQVTTPLPSNAHDEDLMTGILINRPPTEYTVVSRLLVWIQVARILQQVFQHVDENPNPSYEHILELDAQLQQLLDGVPAFFTSDSAHSDRLPPNAAWMRTTFIISSAHKVLTLHRAFFRRYEPSRKRALDASRTILREAARIGDSRMWTVPQYHISAAASVVCLDLFQQASPASTLAAERDEVVAALSTLRGMTSFSAIATRGAALIENLLAEEAKLPALPTSPRTSTKRRRVDSDAAPTPVHDAHAQQTSATSLAKLLASPLLAGAHPSLEASGLVFAPGSSSSPASSASPGTGARRPPAGDIFFAPAPSADAACGAAGTGGLGLSLDDLSPLPASFMSAFLETGFDPLDGAIVGGGGAAGASGGGGGGELPAWLEAGSPFAARDEVRA